MLATSRQVVAVAGDLSESGCGISEAALAEMAAEGSLLVIHSAARWVGTGAEGAAVGAGWVVVVVGIGR